MNSFVIPIAVCILALLITLLAFRKTSKQKKQIVLMGRKGTGKTRLFLALTEKNCSAIKTIPSIDSVNHMLGNSAVLVDTPGADSFERTAEHMNLTKDDLVIYVFNRKEQQSPQNLDTKARIYKIYTGEDAFCDGSIKSIKLSQLIGMGSNSPEIQDILSQIL
ncbi:hypothetical protein NEIG_00077 [Nematocida sp. ERTm5]|nr:hypothetical protein NEIG_00077 [Nematocida sp. ERTm5]